ncbi:hypothetical protein B7P34_29475 [Streptosporangium nondiastaticum]|uniref:Uncharacterized protein n=2 Tax=Streptosporangium nondiastaticum TaxID=35764 RepID=A0A9X7PER1_9ACTN|nr:hypothetical protein B7P34_29475 [Streptosporangium nondiastaticum]
MLSEALVAVAAAGGSAVVQAAGTDAWTGLRERVARWFGRGDEARERVELERLDRTAGVLAAADSGPGSVRGSSDAARVRDRQEGAWQSRFESLLEGLPEEEQELVAEELRALVKEYAAPASSEAQVSGNVFRGPTAFQVGDGGDGNQQDNRFGVE